MKKQTINNMRGGHVVESGGKCHEHRKITGIPCIKIKRGCVI